MSWSTGIIGLYCLVFIVATVTIVFSFRLRHLLGYRALMVAMLAHLIVALSALVIYSSDDFETKVLFSRLRFLGFSLFGPCVLFFVNFLYRKWKWLEHPKAILIFLIPTSITWVLTLVPAFQDYMVYNFSPITVDGLNVLKFQGGPWFRWHLLSSFSCSLIMVIFAIHTFWKERGVKRKQMFIFGSASIFVSLIDIYLIATQSIWRWAMLSGATYVVFHLSVLYAGFRHQLFNIVPYATEKIFRSLPDPILVIDRERRIEAVNDAALLLFQESNIFLGKKVSEILPFSSDSQNEVKINGRYFEVIHEPITEVEKIFRGSIIHLKEITVFKKTEEKLTTHIEFKSQMLSLIAHDVVGSVQAQTSLMQSVQSQYIGESKKIVDLLVDSHESLHDFLKNILNWEKSLSTEFKVVRAPFDIRIFINSCIESLDLVLKLKKIEIESLIKAPSSIVTADSEILSIVLRNILSNAIRASQEGGKIKLSAEIKYNRLFVEVVDYGAGLSQEKIQEILNLAYRPSVAIQPEKGGFGVGLFIVKSFINLHQGEFWLTSEQNLGTRVGFSIPI